MTELLYDVLESELAAPSNEHFQLHNHIEYELYMFLEGDSTYVVEGKNYSLSPDDMIVILRHEMHRVFHNSPKRYRRIVFSISPEFFLKNHCEEYEKIFCSNYFNAGNKINASTVHSSGLYGAVMRLKKYSAGFSLLDSPIAVSIMTEILYLINRISSFEAAENINIPVRNIIDYINNNFTNEIFLEELCSRFYISKYHLCRIFKAATGLTVQGYIRQKRLTLADELIKAGKNLTDAALLSGFSSYSSFYRAYINAYNKNPRKGK